MDLFKPAGVCWCDSTRVEYGSLMGEMIKFGIGKKLNQDNRPDSVLFRSDPSDLARIEKNTNIASKEQEDAGPTRSRIDPIEPKKTMHAEPTRILKLINSILRHDSTVHAIFQ